nr:hypothetical protein [Neobacillus sp. Marseille-Q6967]
MFNDIFFEVKNWWVRNTDNELGLEQFERIESQHTRIRHDEDIREVIRVH